MPPLQVSFGPSLYGSLELAYNGLDDLQELGEQILQVRAEHCGLLASAVAQA